MFGLNGGDDVAELSGSTALERREQRAVATQTGGRFCKAVVVTNPDVAIAKEFVFDSQKLSPLNRKMPTPRQTHGFAAGGAVERLGHRRAPVDDDGLSLLVGDGQTTNVEALQLVGAFRKAIDAPEHQSRVTQIELRQPIDESFVENVPFVTSLERSAKARLAEVAQFPGIGTAQLQAVVGVINERLLVGDVGVRCSHGRFGMDDRCGWRI